MVLDLFDLGVLGLVIWEEDILGVMTLLREATEIFGPEIPFLLAFVILFDNSSICFILFLSKPRFC